MVLLIALPDAPQRFEYTEIHMGVEARVVLHAPDAASARHAARAAFDRIADLDSVMSDYRPDSELMRVCDDGRTGRRTISRDLHRVLRRARDIAVLSDGAFDVTVGPLSRLWRQARRENRLPDPSSIAAAMHRVGPEFLLIADTSPIIELLRPGMRLDLGGIGKGFAADEALAVLVAAGHTRSLVDIGGDIAVGDAPPGGAGWRIMTAGSPQVLHVANCGVATSGDTEQFVEIGGIRYSHIVDPATGLGLTNRSAVTVIAMDATTADALASAVSVLGPQRGRALVDRFESAAWVSCAAPAKKVLIIGIDGLRAEALSEARTPNLDRLIARGCYTDRARTGEITVSGPGWSSMLTGVWMDKHNVRDNAFEENQLHRYPHFFARLKAVRPDAVTVSIVDWIPIDEHILGATGADMRFAWDYRDDGDARMTNAAVGALGDLDPDAMFLYYADLDVAGHDHGFHPGVPEYIAALEKIDGRVGTVLRAVHERPDYEREDWLVIVSTDHGGTIDGGHGRDVPLHRTIPLIVSGSSAARGRLHTTANIVDVAAIALTHLGVDIDPAWDFDGRAIGLDTPARLGVNLIFNGDAEYGRGRDRADDNAGIGGWTDTGAMTVIRYDAQEGFPDADSPGPPHRGNNFFCGGAARETEIAQVIDVANLAAAIDAGLVSWELSGWFGGFAGQRDLASLTATFLDSHGGELGRARIGHVTAPDRAGVTGLQRRSAGGALPPATRRIAVRLFAEAGSGLNDGYADQLSLLLRSSR